MDGLDLEAARRLQRRQRAAPRARFPASMVVTPISRRDIEGGIVEAIQPRSRS
jgi:hypothetical protein